MRIWILKGSQQGESLSMAHYISKQSAGKHRGCGHFYTKGGMDERTVWISSFLFFFIIIIYQLYFYYKTAPESIYFSDGTVKVLKLSNKVNASLKMIHHGVIFPRNVHTKDMFSLKIVAQRLGSVDSIQSPVHFFLWKCPPPQW